jgi:hypothetical protein
MHSHVFLRFHRNYTTNLTRSTCSQARVCDSMSDTCLHPCRLQANSERTKQSHDVRRRVWHTAIYEAYTVSSQLSLDHLRISHEWLKNLNDKPLPLKPHDTAWSIRRGGATKGRGGGPLPPCDKHPAPASYKFIQTINTYSKTTPRAAGTTFVWLFVDVWMNFRKPRAGTILDNIWKNTDAGTSHPQSPGTLVR